jgi:type III restriction enzyme
MRMPYAKTRKSPLLNKAYAYVVSSHFGEAAAALTEKLVNKGFDNGEAQSTIQREPPKVPDLNPNWNIPYNQFKIDEPLKPSDIPVSIEFDNKDTLFFTPDTTGEDIEKVCGKISSSEAADLKWKFLAYKRTDKEPSPASEGVPFTAPRLMFEAPYSGAAQGE